MQKKSVFWNQNWKFILTGKRRNGGFFTPLPRLSSWNWMSWETSWAMDLAVGGSLCTYWNVKKMDLEFEDSNFKFPCFSGLPFWRAYRATLWHAPELKWFLEPPKIWWQDHRNFWAAEMPFLFVGFLHSSAVCCAAAGWTTADLKSRHQVKY